MSLRGIANGDAVAIARKGHLVKSHARYFCTCVAKRNKQAKDKQLSLATIVWSKVKFMTRDVRISRKGILVIKPTQDTFVLLGKRSTRAKE